MARRASPEFIQLADEKDDGPRYSLRLVCISDTHNHHDLLDIPEGDVLIHSGDFTNAGSPSEVEAFNNWLGTLPHTFKLVICGNHEYGLAKFRTNVNKIAEKLDNATHYLQDSGVTICGVRFWGSPWVLNNNVKKTGFNGRMGPHFYLGDDKLNIKWNMIPDDIEYLITHVPPAGLMDNRLGCPALRKKKEQLQHLKYHQFGHVHRARGYNFDKRNVLSINAANGDFAQPFYIDIPCLEPPPERIALKQSAACCVIL